MIKLVIAEDHQILIDGLKSILEKEQDIQVVGEATDGQELMDIVEQLRPDIVLTDIRMPKCDGIQATKFITMHYPETKVIAFSMFDKEDAFFQMQNAGAMGYLVKSSPFETVLKAIKTVYEGEAFYDYKIKFKWGNEPINLQISLREKDILRLIAEGKSSQEIAEALDLSKLTIYTHRKNLIKKFDLTGKNELMRFAIERKYEF